MVTALVIDHLVAEKVRALLMPGKPRDLYDIWLLQRQEVEPDLTVVDRELALYDQEWKRDAIEEALEGVRPEWKQDLRPPVAALHTRRGNTRGCGDLAQLSVR